jgi:alanine racemase
VDLTALEWNFRAIERMVAESAAASGRRAPDIVAVVKANAYGHGAARVALGLESAGARMLACADIEEGVTLREAGVRVPILVFGALGVSQLDGIFAHDLTPTISTPSAASALAAAAARRGVRLSCQLKIDTGMHRLGFRFDNLATTIPAIASSPHVSVDAVYTHFATADLPEHPLFGLQRQRFEDVRDTLARLGVVPPAWHAANSAALLRDERVWFDAVRPGLLLYGVVPPPISTTLDLRPVMTLRSRIVAVKGIRPGEGVSYGMRFTADRATTIAIVPAGYADGLDTRLAGRGHVIVRGRRAPIVGAVCMDMMAIDVTGSDVSPGDDVVIIGRQGTECIDVREMAAAIGTIPWELLCRLGTRIERVYQ